MAFSSSILTSLNNTAAASGSSSTSSTSSAADELSEQFLTLLVAQMQNQDPLNPMENSELTSQLAQINTVSGISQLNDTLTSINGQLDDTQRLQASALVDHGVLIEGSKILAQASEDGTSGVTTPFGVELDSAADSVVAEIRDASGKVVRTLDLTQNGAMAAGIQSFQWDGVMDDGSQADGAYTVALTATQNGEAVTVKSLTYGYVQGVATSGSAATLDLGTAGTVTLDEVRQIL